MAIAGFNKKTVLGGVCLVLLTVGSVLVGSGPVDARAQQPSAGTAISKGPLELVVLGASLAPGITAEHVLQIALRIQCTDEHIGIDWTRGTVRFNLGDGGSIDLPLDVSNVQPGDVKTAYVTVDWNERDPMHRQLRRYAASAQATFKATALRTAELAPAMDPTRAIASGESQAPTPVRASFH
jgi:hypothetical protein